MQTRQVFTVRASQEEKITISAPGEYMVRLVGAGARAIVTGSFAAAEKDECAVTVIISHEAPHTSSDTVLKGVARDSSFVSFTGRIIVAEHCPDTNAFLTERILLLSDTARAQAVPDLEILTDDVKCSHAASISHIPTEQLFYLESRGIPQDAAKQLIVDGFLQSRE